MQTKLLWFLFFFVATEGFGFRVDAWGGLGAASVGWYVLPQALLLGVALFTFSSGIHHLYRQRHTPVGFAVFLISLLPAYMLVVTLLRAFGSGYLSYSDVLANIAASKGLLYIPLLSYLVQKGGGLRDAMDNISIYSFVASVSILIILFFQIETAVVKTLISSDATRFYRALIPTALLVAAGCMIFLSRYLVQGSRLSAIASFVCFSATVAQLHRSVLVAMILAVLVFVFWSLGWRGTRAVRQRSALVVMGAIVGFATGIYAFISNYTLQSFAVESGIEMLLGGSNSMHRFNVMSNTWQFLIYDNFGVGVGFDWEKIDDLYTYLTIEFVKGPTLDSSYANIMITTGLPGMALYILLFSNIARLSSMSAMRLDSVSELTYALFLRAFTIFVIVSGLGSDFVLLSPSSMIFSLVLVAAVALERQRLEKGRPS